MRFLIISWISGEAQSASRLSSAPRPFPSAYLQEQIVVRHDERGDEFMFVGHDDSLVDEFVDDKLRLDHLRRDIFSVRRLEKVFDAFLEEEFSVFHISRVARVEPSVFVNRFARHVFLLVVARRDTLSAQQDFVVFSKLDFNASPMTRPTEPSVVGFPMKSQETVAVDSVSP